MSNTILFGVNNKAKSINSMYYGVNGKAKKIIKAFYGIEGKAKLVYEENNLDTYTISGGYNDLVEIYDGDELLATCQLDGYSGEVSFITPKTNAITIKSTKYNYKNNLYEEVKTVDGDTIKAMPEGSLYWYGNECEDVTGSFYAIEDKDVGTGNIYQKPDLEKYNQYMLIGYKDNSSKTGSDWSHDGYVGFNKEIELEGKLNIGFKKIYAEATRSGIEGPFIQYKPLSEDKTPSYFGQQTGILDTEDINYIGTESIKLDSIHIRKNPFYNFMYAEYNYIVLE